MPIDTPFHFLANFVAGGTSASIAVTVVAPLERIKLLLQVQHVAMNIKPDQQYKGIIDCLIRIPKEEGVLSFWRGNVASIIRCFPYQALNFSMRDVFREQFVDDSPNSLFAQKFLGNLLSGGLAGAFATSVIYPLDYARTRMALDIGPAKDRKFRNARHCLTKTIKNSGIRAIYRGFIFSVFGVFIYRALYFGLYDTIMGTVKPEFAHSLWIEFPVAEFAATTAGFLSYPFDTVRRQLMLRSWPRKNADGQIVKSESTWACWRNIYRAQGIRGFFHGSLTNVYRGTGGAITLVFYDSIQHWLLVDNPSIHRFIPVRHHHEEKVSEQEAQENENEVKYFRYVKKPCKILKDRYVFCNF